MDSLEGQTLGNYKLLEQVGGGEWTAVYKARHEGLDAERLVTLCGGEGCPEDHPFRVRLRERANKAAQVQQPGLPHVTDHGSEKGYDFLVREEARGKVLAEIVAARGKLSPSQATDVALRVAECVDAAIAEGLADATASIDTVLITPDQEVRLTGILNREESRPQPWEKELRAAPDGVATDPMHNQAIGALLYHLATGKARERHKWSIEGTRSVDFDFALRELPVEMRGTLAMLMASDPRDPLDLASGIKELKKLREAIPDTSADDPPLATEAHLGEVAVAADAADAADAAAPAPEEATAVPDEGTPWLVIGMFLFLAAVIYAVYVYMHVKGAQDSKAWRQETYQPVAGRDFRKSVAWQYADVVQRSRKLIETTHFGQALELLNGFVESHPDSEWAEFARDETKRLAQTAARRYRDVKADVQRYKSLGKLDEARAFLDHVIRYYGLPEMVEDAKKEREALDKGPPPAEEGKEPGVEPEPGEPGPAEKPAGTTEEPKAETKAPEPAEGKPEGTVPAEDKKAGGAEDANAEEKLPDAGATKPADPTKPAAAKPAEDAAVK